MKNFNNIKLLSAFREVSDVLEIISKAIRIFALIMIILQGILLFKETKSEVKSEK